MATITAQTLITAGLKRADMQSSTVGFIANTPGGQTFDILNAAISELYDILYEADSESHAMTLAAFSTVQAQANYALLTIAGSTFYHLRGVDYNDGVRWHDLDRVNFQERNKYSSQGIPRGYSIEGDNLTIYPDPGGVYSMRIYYVPNPPIMALDADPIDLKGPWREYIEKHFAAQCLDIAELDSATIKSDVLALANRIRSASKKRDAGKPITVVDVQGDWDPWNPFGGMSRG